MDSWMLTKTARKYCINNVNTSGLKAALDSAHLVHPQDIFRRTDAPKSLSAIHLTQVSEGKLFR